MKRKFNNIEVAAIIAGAALIPTAVVFVSTYIEKVVSGSIAENFNVNASVNANCKFPSTANDLDFGAYDPVYDNLTADLDASTTFDIKCTKGTSVVLKLGLGNYSVGNQRRLRMDAANYMNYDLYSDASRTTVWNPTVYVTFTAPSSSTITETVYGRVPAGQDLSAGTYTDVVTITASF